ncbi:Centromere protein J [Trichuris trichiura]|uniref:Centromere protein J n=1 Tax=Trichuris trichiura TaxID=36087 RepID=A0A077ZJ93_TRITR|nr:Centromere protein J [Trichuris trichiura]
MSDSSPFPFLKRGDGMKKYSKIQYPVFKRASENAAALCADEFEHNKVNCASDPALQKNVSEEPVSSVSASPSTSCLQAMENIEVKQFELLEKLAQELSLSDSSAYLRLLNEVHPDTTGNHSAPVANGLQSDMQQAGPFTLTSGQDSSGTAASELLSKKSVDIGAVVPSSSSSLSSIPSSVDSTIVLQKRLETMVEQLEKDARDVESVQAILAKKSALLESEKTQLEKEKADFEKEKEEQLKSINSERQFLRQQQKATRKKETDVVAVLRQQISDLQNEICDKESRCSGLRSRIRTLESELSACKDDLLRWREKFRHLEESNVRLDQENAQLRLKINSIRNGGPTADTEASALLIHHKVKGIQRSSLAKKTCAKALGGDKSVRFLLPDEEPAEFVRTENRAVQTDLDSAREGAVVIPSIVAHQKFFATNNQADERNTGIMQHPTRTFERVRADGSTESMYANGTVQEVSPDGQTVTYHYSNGDSRRLLPDGSEASVYLFSSKGLVQIRDPSGLLKLKHSDGRTEIHHLDGRIELEFPEDGSGMTIFPDGRQSKRFADGTSAERSVDGTEIFCFKDGSKETRCKDYMRRDFPNGDVKIKHADGTEETRYASGRLRLKDPTGKVIRDEIFAWK